jgi:hypothetical protein
MRLIRFGLSLGCTAILAGCGANGILGLTPKPDGNIVLTNAVSGAAIQTSLASPMMIGDGSFSIGITENYFSGPYTITVESWTAPFNIPCFVPHYVDSSSKTNVVRFQPDNAAPVTTPTQPSPCNEFTNGGGLQTDEETALITDNDGHQVKLFYKISPSAY